MNDNTVVGDDGDLEAIKEKALLIVTNAIQGATDTVGNLQKEEAGAKYEVPNIAWMKCQDFTIGKGLLQIEEYMRTWELHESWLHWTNYLGEEELQYSMRYHYRVRWSIPTCRKPIPRATACVYFVIEISKIRPSVSTQNLPGTSPLTLNADEPQIVKHFWCAFNYLNVPGSATYYIKLGLCRI